MYRRFHDRFGTAGVVIAVIALIAALGGSALAAGGLTGQQKKEVKKIAKKYAGKQGPQGLQGLPGANGTNGKDGTNGLEGKEGPEGPEGGEGPEGPEGPEGSPWTAGGTLPSGETETGAWGGSGDPESESGVATVSFAIPLAGPLDEAHVAKVPNEGENENCDDGSGEAASVANPEADPGYLCVFSSAVGKGSGVLIASPKNFAEAFTGGASTTGAVVFFTEAPAGRAWGTWAVTAP
jgi:hypothetical protein